MQQDLRFLTVQLLIDEKGYYFAHLVDGPDCTPVGPELIAAHKCTILTDAMFWARIALEAEEKEIAFLYGD